MDIKLTNTKTRKKEGFTPIDPTNVRMYVCGPTVYDRAHIGNARPAIVFDTLYRLLRHRYGADQVTYVRNFTDVDDKINARAAESGRSIGEITEETIGWYLNDMAAAGVMGPDHMPRATQFIPQMVEMIEALIAKGHAYAAEGHALFAVDSYKNYGALSGRSVDDMIAGARVEIAPYKRNPMDFVLWKPSSDDQPGWDSPWGRGRPGWHIECSAMAYELLGKTFDIHGGGNDLMFPHHENEIAQSCCAHPDGGFANVWMHNEMLQVEGKKMSKSLGNFFTVRDLLEQGVPGEVIRFVMLSTHYRKPMDWTVEKSREAEGILRKWRAMAGEEPAGAKVAPAVESAVADDLNTPGAIAELHRIYEALRNAQAQDPKAANILNVPDDLLELAHAYNPVDFVAGLKAIFVASANLLGVLTPELAGWDAVTVDLGGYAQALAALRETAMETKDFSGVDKMKKALIGAGVEVRMSKAGVDLVPGAGFDAALLEGIK